MSTSQPIGWAVRRASTAATRPRTARPRPASTWHLRAPRRLHSSKKPRHEPQSLNQLLATRKTPLVAAGLAAAVMGCYIVVLAISIANGPKELDLDGCAPSGRPADLRSGKISAALFDKELDRSEWLMGVTGLRRLMGGLARGHVLEVAIGTGRNVEYVDWDEIRAMAPPVADTREVKSALQLERERVARRLVKGDRGMVLPGDEEPEVVSYTGVDVSTDVLEVAWGKLKKAVPDLIQRRKKASSRDEQQQAAANSSSAPASASASASAPASAPSSNDDDEVLLAANIGQGRIRLFKADAQHRLPPPPVMTSHDSTKLIPAPPCYDTILQNFGLCSVADPLRLLANMAAVLRPSAGRIYLLEHGRGSFGWLNGLLDKFAPSHFARFGCWWNRDIEQIVRRAEKEIPGLEVVRIQRPLWTQGGTMLWVELKVNPLTDRRA